MSDQEEEKSEPEKDAEQQGEMENQTEEEEKEERNEEDQTEAEKRAKNVEAELTEPEEGQGDEGRGHPKMLRKKRKGCTGGPNTPSSESSMSPRMKREDGSTFVHS